MFLPCPRYAKVTWDWIGLQMNNKFGAYLIVLRARHVIRMHYIEQITYIALLIYIGTCVYVLNSHRISRTYYADHETGIRYMPFILVKNLTIRE